MNSKIIDGKLISEFYLNRIKNQVNELHKKNITIGLAVVLVGEDPASKVYVANKQKACMNLGIYSKTINLSANSTQQEVEEVIELLNEDKNITAILVQLPLPKHLNEESVIARINSKKDVDGFHVINSGKLLKSVCCIEPCTPKGVMEMLNYMQVPIEGKKAVIVGRSNLVGKPLAIMLLKANATVTICHSKTKNLADECKNADILVAAIGAPNFIKEDMVKNNAVVIDVGITRTENGLVGDVDFNNVYKKVSLITPVPGGVGRMTIAMLMQNTIETALLNAN